MPTNQFSSLRAYSADSKLMCSLSSMGNGSHTFARQQGICCKKHPPQFNKIYANNWPPQKNSDYMPSKIMSLIVPII